MTSILVVEDELLVAEDLKYSLEHLGYKVKGTASSGDRAIAKARDLHPDLILMDIVLKGDMSGIEAARAIRAEYNVPVIYLTAHSDKNTLAKAKQTSPYGYILKPFDEHEVSRSIEAALSKHRSGGSSG